MRTTRLVVALLLVVAACGHSTGARKPGDVAKPGDAQLLGSIDFPVTGGSEDARGHFLRGVLAMHSFWYDEAVVEFQAATKADPAFAMGWWGLAMSHAKLLWMDDDLAAGRAALEHIKGVDALSARERAWVAATRGLFGEGNPLERRQGFATALAGMHREFPDDDEITTFYALALIASVAPESPDEVAIRVQAAALAMDVFQRNPLHPGAAHYIIHALDTVDLAPMALAAARAYAKIAPEAFHARHMPAHIFGRMGLWTDALASCQAAWDASVAWVAREKLPPDSQDFHSLNWIFELDFELGRRHDAAAALALYGDAVKKGLGHGLRGQYADEVGSYLMHTEEWSRVDELLAPLEAPSVEPKKVGATCEAHTTPAADDPYAPPLEVFEALSVNDVRTLAAVKRHDVEGAKKGLERRMELIAQITPWAERTLGKPELERQMKWLARGTAMGLAEAGGDDTGLLALQVEAAAELDKMPVGEGGIYDGGAHEPIAETLMRLGRAAEALAEYRVVLKKHPRRAHALLGAARAAVKVGDEAAALGYYQTLLDVWSTADADMPGLEEARQATAKR